MENRNLIFLQKALRDYTISFFFQFMSDYYRTNAGFCAYIDYYNKKNLRYYITRGQFESKEPPKSIESYEAFLVVGDSKLRKHIRARSSAFWFKKGAKLPRIILLIKTIRKYKEAKKLNVIL
jgi:hypothetical protein